MKLFLQILFFAIFAVSCKTTNFTGISNYKSIALARLEVKAVKPLILDESDSNTPLEEPIFLATNRSRPIAIGKITEKLKLVNKNSSFIKAEIVAKKRNLKDKLALKIIQNKISKINKTMVKPQPDGFNNLDNQLKIGLILLAVALGLAIVGLGGLAGIAGLIALIFIVLGLLNTYN